MSNVVFAIPGEIDKKSGGYLYDRKLIAELSTMGFDIRTLELAESFPLPDLWAMEDAQSKLIGVPSGDVLIIDGLAFGALSDELVNQIAAPIIALVHHPLAEETGLDPNLRSSLYLQEHRNLKMARAVIVTSEYTARLLTEKYDVEKERITVATPGFEQQQFQRAPQSAPLILSVGIQVFRKGHDVLLRALSKIKDLEWQALIAGAAVDPKYATDLQALLVELGLETRVRLAGFVSEQDLTDLYAKATIFALATRFEGYGIVFNEALGYELPIVSCDVGAVSETLGSAGVLVPKEDSDGFAVELRNLLTDSKRLQSLEKNSRSRALSLPSWSQSFSKVAQLLDSLNQAG